MGVPWNTSRRDKRGEAALLLHSCLLLNLDGGMARLCSVCAQGAQRAVLGAGILIRLRGMSGELQIRPRRVRSSAARRLCCHWEILPA